MHFPNSNLQLGQGVVCLFSHTRSADENPAAPDQKTSAKASQDGLRNTAEKLAKKAILGAEKSAAVWDEAFTVDPPTPEQFSAAIAYLHERKHYNVAVEGMLSAIRNDQAFPRIYDILSLEMKLAGRPPKEIARVLESRIDFVTSDVPQMLITVAFLSRFEAWDEAISVCREAAELNPEISEVWMLGRSVADKSGRIEAQAWARCGILTYVWGGKYELHHEEARRVLRELASRCDRESKSELGEQIRIQAAEAEAVDLQIVLNWVGTADLDLLITEPDGEKCSFRRRITSHQGRLVREDGPGDDSRAGEKRSERYVCHSALSGEYEIDVRFVLGKAVAGTAVLEIIQHSGTASEQRTSKIVTLSKDDVRINMTLRDGRGAKHDTGNPAK